MSEMTTAEHWASSLGEPLLRFALSLGLTSHDAEDAAQEALISLVDALEKRPDSIDSPKAYAFTIVRNNAYKHYRERARRNEVEMPENHSEQSAAPDKFEEPLLKESFKLAYAELSPQERELIQKYYVDGLNYRQIGNEMGCSPQNVWKLLKKIVSKVLAGEVRKTLTQIDPEYAKELFTR